MSRATALLLISALLPITSQAATIEGRVVHPTHREASAGVAVFLIGIARTGDSVEQHTTGDDEGRFVFRDLRRDAAYLIGATYGGVSFSGGSIIFEEGSPDQRTITFHIYDRSEKRGSTVIEAIRYRVEREAGVYSVRQLVVLDNPTLRVIVVDESAEPLHRIALAPEHGEIETPLGRLPDGAVVRNGVLELRGPIYPGQRTYGFRYDVPASGRSLDTELTIAEATLELDLLVRDFGVDAEVGFLYPARAVREGDTMHLRYIGFDLPAQTRISLRLTPLEPRSPMPSWLRALLVLGLGGGLLALVRRPVAQRAAGPENVPLEEEPEEQALRAALSDLEFDYETGKVSAEDRDLLRKALRQEAVHTLAVSRAGATPPPAQPRCSCGRTAQPGDQYCAGCGKKL